MGYVRIVGLVVLLLGSSNLFAGYTVGTYANGNNVVKVTITDPSTTNACTYTNAQNTLTDCGYAENIALATAPKWHAGPGGKTDSAFLNNLDSKVSYTLATTAGLHPYDPNAPCAACSPTGGMEAWRTPSSDYGYILSTNDGSASSTGGITITGTTVKTTTQYFQRVSFYWGSVDPWNEIIFTDAANSTKVTVTGSDLKSQGVSVPCTVPANCTPNSYNNTDVLVDFQVGTTCYPNSPPCTVHSGDSWSSIQLLSCDGAQTPTCAPAFEIDNLEYLLTTTKAPVSFGLVSQSPVPEPTGLLLMSTGVIGIAGWLRRKVRC